MRRASRIHKGSAVRGTDGVFGQVADVVVDPLTNELTHIVIEPSNDHRQKRLVPVWMTEIADDGVHVDLDLLHIRQLQRVLTEDFVRSTPPPGFASDMPRRFKTVLNLPYFHDDQLQATDAGQDEVDRRIPVDSCEIRRKSSVLSCNDRMLGTVEGFLVDDGLIHAVVVRSGLAGFREDVAVPIRLVSRVLAELITLSIDRHEFRSLRAISVVPARREALSPLELVRHELARCKYAVRDRLMG